MPAPSKDSLLDGVSQVSRGMNSGVMPRLIPIGQVAMAVNCTFRNGLPRTRPVWRKVPLTYADEALHANATAALFQRANFHRAYGSGENCLVASIGGHLFRYLVGSSNAVQDVSVSISAGLTVAFVAPAINSTVTLTIASTTGLIPGMMLTIAGGNYQIVTVTSPTTILVRNLNVTAGTAVAAGTLTIYTDLNNPINPDCWMWQAEDFQIIQNGAADPLFFDGTKTRRSLGDGGSELPAGCMGAYVQKRVWMTLPDASQKPSQAFMAGDLAYSHGYNDGYNGRAAVLKTEENTLFSGAGSFTVPVDAGPITAMGCAAIADNSTGQGSLQVGTADSITSVQVPALRENWAADLDPSATIGLVGYGPLSQESFVRVNGDLWYRATDGFRSYQIGRRDLNTWVNTPLSVEVEKIISLDDEGSLNKSNGVLFDNRLLETCSPFTHSRGTAHRGIIALDFNGISTLTSRSLPAYDGLWTGLNVLQLVKGRFGGRERCFAFVVDACDRIALYELMRTESGWFDYDGTGNVPVESFFVSRSMGWKDAGNILKKLQCGDVYLDRLAGDPQVDFEFQYRSDEDQTWRDWHSFSLCAPVRNCLTGGCPTWDNVREQYRTYLRLPDPADTFSAITKRLNRTGYEFQVLFRGTGFWQLNRLHLWAKPESDSVVTSCPSSETCVLMKGCDEPWFDYAIETSCSDPIPAGGVPATAPLSPGDPGTVPGEGTPDQPPPTPVADPVPTDRGGTGTPVWPPPTPVGEPTPVPGRSPTDPVQYPCGEAVTLSQPISILDPVSGHQYPVGIMPPFVADDPYAITPADYVSKEVLDAWSAAVWAAWGEEKLSIGANPTTEYITWWYYPIANGNWDANEVFPGVAGGYSTAYGKDWKLVIAWC